MKRMLTVAGLVLAGVVNLDAAVVVRNLQVEYRATPLGIDVERPRFGWQMAATAGERGVSQAAYRIEVKDPGGDVAWDSGRVEGRGSVAIPYAGRPLSAATRYHWTITAWTPSGTTSAASSWFETGLMDPKPGAPAWSGATWIGGGSDALVLYAPYLEIFELSCAVSIAEGSTRASVIYGANDSRLMDRFKNIYQVQNAKDRSYVKIELDVAPVDGTPAGRARLNVYRAGYTGTDNPDVPLRSIPISTDIVNAANRHAEHRISFHSAMGLIGLSVDGRTDFAVVDKPKAQPPAPGGFPARGEAPNEVNVNPVGLGGDYLAFGMLCDIGFSAAPSQKATFRDLTVRNDRAPRSVLFAEDLSAASYAGIYADAVRAGAGLSVVGGRYVVDGGSKGLFVVRDPSRNAAPMLRTTFKAAPKPIAAARLYVTARGIYEVYLNGRRVGDDYCNPGFTQYNVTHLYQTYDVTPLVKGGQNALGAMLGEGWWSGQLGYGTVWNHFGDRQSLLAKLVVAYQDGTSDVVTTNDRTWKYFTGGPVVYASLYHGEIYDAGRETRVAGWATAAYDDRTWRRAATVPLEGTTFNGTEGGAVGRGAAPFPWDTLALVGQIGESAGVYKTLTAKSVKEVRPGVFVYDMGQNIVGVPRIRIQAGRAGRKVTLRFAEMLYPALKESGKNVGMIMTENYRAAVSQDVYTMKAGSQVIQPRFTSHGYQYVEITGIERPLPVAAVQGLAMSSVRRLSASYETSSPKVNRLWSNLVWSNVDNFLSIPTDCPQRNERLGWSGDLSVFSRTATYLSNADQFLTRHMFAMRDTQGATGRFADVAPVGGGFGGVLWGSAGIVVPWENYLQYGDVALLERHYPAMAAYVGHLEASTDPNTGLTTDGQLGDWLGPQVNALGAPFLATAYHAYDLGIMARVAELLGKAPDAARYRELYQKRKAFFNKTFVNAEKKTLATGSGFGGFGPPRRTAPPAYRVADTQSSYAVGLGLGLFDQDLVPTMARSLAETVTRKNTDDDGKVRPEYSLMTGFIGTAWISQVLSDTGHADLAYRLLHNEQYPSWLYAVDQGATTIWERLNGYTVENGFGGNNSMNSFNHYSFGAVGQWMLAYSLGIQRGEPGFRTFVLRPEPDPTGTMTWARGHYDSMYGRIESAWAVKGGQLSYHATVPGNTVATLVLPAKDQASVKVGGVEPGRVKGVTLVKYADGQAVYELGSGVWNFTAAWGPAAK